MNTNSFLRYCLPMMMLVLSACELPAPGVTPPPVVGAAQTQAVQTVIAQFTSAALTQAPILPTNTPAAVLTTSLPTPTQPAPTSTFTPEPATATPTSTSTPPASPTPTLPPSDPRLTLGNPDFHEPFKDGANWAIYEDDHVAFEAEDGWLKMKAFKADGWDGWMLTWPSARNYYLEIAATTKQCSGLDRYGLMARATDTDQGYAGYLFYITCDGHYSLRIWDSKKFARLVDWTESEHILVGSNQTNRIGFMLDGERLALYANGYLLKEIRNTSYKKGTFGVFIGAVNTPDFTVLVDYVDFWELP